jgi:autotransporter-associated beta strand protein
VDTTDTIQSISGAGTVSVGNDISFEAVTLTVDHSDNHTFSGSLVIPLSMDEHTFVKAGSGTLTLSGASTSNRGTVTVSEGILSVTHSDALGYSTTSVSSGAALHLSNDITIANSSIRLNGTGISSNGALRNTSGDNIITRWVLLGSDTKIQVDSGSTLSIQPTSHYSKGITGTYVGNNRNLTLDVDGSLTITKNVDIGTKALTKEGAGTLTSIRHQHLQW